MNDEEPTGSPPPRMPSRKRESESVGSTIVELQRVNTLAILPRQALRLQSTSNYMPVIPYANSRRRSSRNEEEECFSDDSDRREGVVNAFPDDGIPVVQLSKYKVTYTGNKRPDEIYAEHKKKYVRFIAGQRIVPQTDTDEPTWMCYVECHHSVRNNVMKYKVFANTVSDVQPWIGSRDAGRAYCTDDNNRLQSTDEDVGPITCGKWAKQGERTDIANCKDQIMNGVPMEIIRQEHTRTYAQCHRALNDIAADRARIAAKKKRNITVHVYYGNAGAGKTHTATLEAQRISGKEDGFYILTSGAAQSGGTSLWLDGYTGETCLIIEEYDGWLDWPFFLKLLEGDFLPCQVKGSVTYAMWTHVWITSNLPVEHWSSIRTEPTDEQRLALYRRIDVLIWMKSRDEHITIKDRKDTPYDDTHYIEWKRIDDDRKKQRLEQRKTLVRIRC